ncbi:MAG TPA: hypothetical protein VHB02_06005 [Acidimicrobiales bacterium]|nr:hypothetical protein [Acidimicrobiales bacterium]
MSDYDAGSVYLQVIPSFRGVIEAIAEEAKSWGSTAGTAFATEFNRRVKEETSNAPLGPSEEDSTEQGSKSAGKFADGFKARLTAALRALPEVEIDANSSDADRKVAEVRAALEELRSQTIGVDITDTEALARAAELQAVLDRLKAEKVDISVRMNAAAASAELAAIATEADAVNAESGGAASGITAMASDMADAISPMGLLIGGLGALATTLIPIGGLAAGAFATLPALVAGAASGIGALKLGLSGIGGAITAYMKQQTQATQVTAAAGKSASTAAEQALSAADTQRNAANSVASAKEALANAETSSARQIAQANQAVATAEQEADQAVVQAQAELKQSEQSLTDARYQAAQAQRNLTEAQYEATQAQEALTQARIDAANALTSLTDQVAQGALNIRQANADLATALTALNAAQAKPTTSAKDLAALQLAYDQAAQRVKTLTDQQAQLQTAFDAATAAGVTGSKQVVSAQHAVTDATHQVADAQHSVTKAIQQVDAAMQDVADKTAAITTAQVTGAAKVAAAQTAAALAQITGAQQVQDATNALNNALADQASALQRIALEAGTGGGGGGGAAAGVNQFAQAMSKLTPIGRQFVDYVTGTLLPEYTTFKAQVQEALLPGLLTGLKAMAPVLTAIKPYIVEAATGIGQLAASFGQFLGSAQGQKDVNAIFSAGASFMRQMGSAALTLFKAFTDGGAKAAPVLGTIGTHISHLVDSLAHWISTGGFTKFLQWLKTNGPGLVHSIGDFAKSIGTLIVSLEPIGRQMLVILGYIGQFAGWVAKNPIVLVLNPLGLILAPMIAIGIGLDKLVRHWSTVWQSIHNIVNTVWHAVDNDVFHPIENFFTNTIPHALDVVGNAFVTAWDAVRTAVVTAWQAVDSNVIQPVVHFFTTVIPGAATIVAHAFEDAWNAVRTAVVTAWQAVDNNVVHPIVHLFTTVIPGALTTVGNAFVTAWNTVRTAMVSAWQAVDNNVVHPIVHFFTTTIPDSITKAIGFFTGLPGKIGSALSGFFDVAFHALTDVAGWLTTHVWQPISSFFTGLPGRIAHAAEGMWDGIGNAFIGAINAVIRVWDNFKFPKATFGLLGSIGGWSLPHIDPIDPITTKAQARATGGPVEPGIPYLVGEKGPEIRTFDSPGNISPTTTLQSILAALRPVDLPGRSGPAVEIHEANFHDEADVEMLMRRTTFALMAGRL